MVTATWTPNMLHSTPFQLHATLAMPPATQSSVATIHSQSTRRVRALSRNQPSWLIGHQPGPRRGRVVPRISSRCAESAAIGRRHPPRTPRRYQEPRAPRPGAGPDRPRYRRAHMLKRPWLLAVLGAAAL